MEKCYTLPHCIEHLVHDRSMNRTLGVAEFLTNLLTSKSTKPELVTDKRRKDLEMNRSVIMPEKEAEITSIGDIVNKQMVHLKAMKGKLDEKQQQIVQKWKKKNAMASGFSGISWSSESTET